MKKMDLMGVFRSGWSSCVVIVLLAGSAGAMLTSSDGEGRGVAPFDTVSKIEGSRQPVLCEEEAPGCAHGFSSRAEDIGDHLLPTANNLQNESFESGKVIRESGVRSMVQEDGVALLFRSSAYAWDLCGLAGYNFNHLEGLILGTPSEEVLEPSSVGLLGLVLLGLAVLKRRTARLVQ